MIAKASDEELAGREALAGQVRRELVAAGLPVVAEGLGSELASGAEVEVDPVDDAAGGVYIVWQESPRLRHCALRAFRLRQLDEPVLQHSYAIGAAMMEAIATILASAGFSVEDARNEYRPQQMRVLAAPPSGRQPTWQLRGDELTLPGWPQGATGDQPADFPAERRS